MQWILGHEVEGDPTGVAHLEHIGHEAEALFEEAKINHRAEFQNHEGRHFVMTRESAGHYLVAHVHEGTGWV